MTTDYLGEWKYHGTITPQFDVWTEFPEFTAASNSIVRVTYYFDNLPKVLSKGFLRAVYRTPDIVRDRNWIRLYPKPEKEILSVNTVEEILINKDTIPRYYEIIKSFRSKYPYGYGSVVDEGWSIALESLEIVNLPPAVQQLISTTTSDVISLNQLLLLL